MGRIIPYEFQIRKKIFSSEFYDGQPSLISIGDLPKLTELHLCDNILVNNDVLRAISIGCKSLEILDIALSSRHVTDMGLNYLGNMTSLTELNLLSQRALTDDTLIQIVNRGTLKELFIGKCTGITNVSVLQAIKMCKVCIASLLIIKLILTKSLRT
jgi:hypothetical protein